MREKKRDKRKHESDKRENDPFLEMLNKLEETSNRFLTKEELKINEEEKEIEKYKQYLKCLQKEYTTDSIIQKLKELNTSEEKKEYLIKTKYEFKKHLSVIDNKKESFRYETFLFTNYDNLWREEIDLTIKEQLELLDLVITKTQQVLKTITGNKEKRKNEDLESFWWTGTPGQRELLFDYLVEEDFISKDENENNFINIFSGVKVNTITPEQRIKWIDKNPNNEEATLNLASLNEFIILLREGNLISQHKIVPTEAPFKLYEKIKGCFLNSDGTEIIKSIRRSHNDFVIKCNTFRKYLLATIIDSVKSDR